MALSSMGHSQTSAQSLQSIAAAENERKISFVLHEPDNESENSSNTTVTMQGEDANKDIPMNTNRESTSIELFSHFYAKWTIIIITIDCAKLAIQQRRPVTNVRPFLLRRGTQATAPAGGSFKRRSLKLRRGTKEGKDLESDCNFLFTVHIW